MLKLDKFDIIDISFTVIPGENPDRPFAIQKSLLEDRTFRYDILKTHSHVGTHVEVGAHFYHEGKSITDYHLERFHGPGILFSIKDMDVTWDTCEKALGGKIKEEDIIVIRNDTGKKITKQQIYTGDEQNLPSLSASSAKWMAKFKPKLIVLDFIRLGKNIEEIRQFHDILMRENVNFVEFVENLDRITKDRFYVMALPYKVQGLDSSFCRAIVLQEK